MNGVRGRVRDGMAGRKRGARRFSGGFTLLELMIVITIIFILLGLAAYWSRLTTADAAQPMPVMVWLTVIHTVLGAILFAFSVLIVLLCYRIIPQRGSRRGHEQATARTSLDKGPVAIG